MTQLKIPDFIEDAFGGNYSSVDEQGDIYDFYCIDIGKLHVINGQIIACDPLLFYENKPFDTLFPIGHFSVEIAVAKINTDERIGLSRIKFSETFPTRWTMAVTDDQDINKLSADDYFGYGVDSGTGCFMDTSGANEYLNYLQGSNNYTTMIDQMQNNYRNTRSWFLWERSGFNVAMFSAGWGDGLYASYIGYDKANSICRLVTDFGLLNWS